MQRLWAVLVYLCTLPWRRGEMQLPCGINKHTKHASPEDICKHLYLWAAVGTFTKRLPGPAISSVTMQAKYSFLLNSYNKASLFWQQSDCLTEIKEAHDGLTKHRGSWLRLLISCFFHRCLDFVFYLRLFLQCWCINITTPGHIKMERSLVLVQFQQRILFWLLPPVWSSSSLSCFSFFSPLILESPFSGIWSAVCVDMHYAKNTKISYCMQSQQHAVLTHNPLQSHWRGSHESADSRQLIDRWQEL